MAGQEVYRFAVSKVPECIKAVLDEAGYTDKEIDHFVCHQANDELSIMRPGVYKGYG